MEINVKTLFEPGDKVKYLFNNIIHIDDENGKTHMEYLKETRVGDIETIKVTYYPFSKESKISYEITRPVPEIDGCKYLEDVDESNIISTVNTKILKGFSTEELQKEIDLRKNNNE